MAYHTLSQTLSKPYSTALDSNVTAQAPGLKSRPVTPIPSSLGGCSMRAPNLEHFIVSIPCFSARWDADFPMSDVPTLFNTTEYQSTGLIYQRAFPL